MNEIGLRQIITNGIGKRVYRILKWLSENFMKVGLALLAVILAFAALGTILKPLLFMSFFLFLGSLSLIYNRWIKTSLGFEFIMLGTVLCTRVYGVGAGVFVGLISLTAAEIIGSGFNPRTVISLAAIVLIAFITPFFNTLPIGTAGLILVLVYDAIIIPMYLIAGSSPFRCALFAITHILWSVWVFFALAPILERLMHL